MCSPGAARTEVAGLYGGRLKLRLAARAVDGKANAALVEFIAERLGAARRDVTIEAGLSPDAPSGSRFAVPGAGRRRCTGRGKAWMNKNPAFERLKTITAVVYALQAAAYFTGLTALVGVIVNYVKLDDVRGTWLESHFRWQIRTFWFALLWFVLGALSWIVFVGMIVVGATAIWVIYRIVKGWLNLYEERPMYAASVPPSAPPSA